MKGNYQKIDIPLHKYKEYLLKIVEPDSLDCNGSKFTFRCPICGDSAKNSFKKRGFLLTNADGNSTMGCQNCGHKESFTRTLKEMFPSIYRNWIMDVYFVNATYNSLAIKEPTPIPSYVDYSKFLPVNVKSGIFQHELVRKSAVSFIKKRRIPLDIAKNFLYCPEYPEYKYVNRVIIPHYNRDHSYDYFEARDLTGKSFLRYKYPPGIAQKYYNINFIDKTRTFFIFEGTIDSFFVENSFACGGASKLETALSMIDKKYHKNAVLVFDGDEDGIRIAHKMLNRGYRVFIWNAEMFKYAEDKNGKKKIDMNELVIKGFFDNSLDDHGQIKQTKIMEHVFEPSMHNVFSFEINYKMLGFELEVVNDRSFQKRR